MCVAATMRRRNAVAFDQKIDLEPDYVETPGLTPHPLAIKRDTTNVTQSSSPPPFLPKESLVDM